MTGSRLRRSALATGGAALLLAAIAPAGAQTVPRPPPELRLCAPTGPCVLYPGRMVIQANALGRTSGIAAATRGLEWSSDAGYVTLAVPRPLDYRGGPVRVGVFYYIGGADGDEGTVGARMRPVRLVPGGGYETYGSVSTALAPANPDTHYEQWAVVSSPEIGFNGSGPWWNVEIGRQGTYSGRLHLLTVVVEYR